MTSKTIGNRRLRGFGDKQNNWEQMFKRGAWREFEKSFLLKSFNYYLVHFEFEVSNISITGLWLFLLSISRVSNSPELVKTTYRSQLTMVPNNLGIFHMELTFSQLSMNFFAVDPAHYG